MSRFKKLHKVFFAMSFICAALALTIGWAGIPATTVSGQSSFTIEDNTDRMYGDYKDFDLSESNYKACQNECARDSNCLAFTYVRPGVQGAKARCWLKNSVPRAAGSTCCITGVKNNGGGNNSGSFAGQWNANVPGFAFPMTLSQDGNSVTGDLDGGRGKIAGVVSGKTMRFRYTYNETKGAGTFVLSDDGKSFKGFYSQTDNPDDGSKGHWNGTKP